MPGATGEDGAATICDVPLGLIDIQAGDNRCGAVRVHYFGTYWLRFRKVAVVYECSAGAIGCAPGAASYRRRSYWIARRQQSLSAIMDFTGDHTECHLNHGAHRGAKLLEFRHIGYDDASIASPLSSAVHGKATAPAAIDNWD